MLRRALPLMTYCSGDPGETYPITLHAAFLGDT